MWFGTSDQARQHVIPLPWPGCRQRCVFGLLLIGAISAYAQAPAEAQGESPPPPVLIQKQTAGEALRLGEAALRQKRSGDAVNALREALRLDPSLHDARRLLADTLYQTGRRAEALPEYAQLLAQRPDAMLYERVIGLLRAAGNTIDALTLAQRALQAFPADPRFTVQAVELLLLLGDTTSARKLVEQLPKDSSSDLLRARTAEQLGAWSEAYRSYQRAIRAQAGKEAEDGRKRALGHAVRQGRWLVFAPAPWTPEAGGAVFMHPELGLELKLEASGSGTATDEARGAVSARFPKSLFSMLAPEDRIAIETKIKEHKPGTEGHFDTSDEDRQHASELLVMEPVRVEVEPLGKDGAGFAYSVFRNGEKSVGVPVFAMVPAKFPVVYVLSGRLDPKTARELFQALLAAGVMEEAP